MADSFRDVEGVPVRIIKQHALPSPEGRRADAEVDNGVEYRTPHAGHVFGLAGRHIGEVDAAHGTSGGHGHVRLGQPQRVPHRLGEPVEPVPLKEEASCVAVLRGDDLPGTLNSQRQHLHSAPVDVLCAWSTWPPPVSSSRLSRYLP